MNIDTWANIGVSIGTISLAILTYYSIKNSNKQLHFLKSQQRLMKNEMNPFLQVSDVSFNENTIQFKIKNIGAGNAHEVGVSSFYEPVILTNLAGDDDNSFLYMAKIALEFKDVYEIENSKRRSDKWLELFNKGKLKEYYPKLWFERTITKMIDPFIDGKKKINSNSFVSFQSTKYTNFVITSHEEDKSFKCEPLFNAVYEDVDKMMYSQYYIYKVAAKSSTITRHFNLGELIEIMKYNEMDFFHLNFDLRYKNRYEDTLESVPLANFVFSIKEHTNLEEAFNQDFSIGKIIGHREVEQKLKGTPLFQYIHAKSNFNYYEEIQ